MGFGVVTVELTSADVTGLLDRITDMGISLQNLGEIDGLTVCLSVDRKQFPLLKRICADRGASLRILRLAGPILLLRRALKRPVLLIGIIMIGVLTMLLPTRILFIEVDGVDEATGARILASIEQCGIRFGAERSRIRSEKVKNQLLESLPELQWAGVNTYGCRAVISVRQRTQVEQEQNPQGISSLVAIRDGVVQELVVLQGNPVCKVGQSVKKGQVLISGYTDLGICIRGTWAKGEVFAETRHSLEVVAPSETVKKTVETRREKKYSLIFGKNRINFFKGSGISGGSCDKMYSYEYVTLPGGFQLPVALVTEVYVWHDETGATQDGEAVGRRLSKCAEDYLKAQMIAGRIDARQEIVTPLEGLYYQIGEYACYEMIGRVRPEEDLGTNEIN